MAVFKNADGLAWQYGRTEGRNVATGEYNRLGPMVITEVTLELADCPAAATAGAGIISDSVTIPAGAYIEKVVTIVTVETAGANANLDLGLIDQDRTTEIDFNGFLAAADVFNGGTDIGQLTEFVVGVTEVGALVGTITTNTGLLTANYDTAAFTAGTLVIRVFWSKPPTKTDAFP